jgi:hypothetical protein
MRQYTVLYKRGTGDFAVLQPNVHKQLYDRLDVNNAIEHMRKNRTVQGMAIVVADEMWNVMAFTQPAQAPNGFLFNDGPIEPQEPIDAQAVLAAAGVTS